MLKYTKSISFVLRENMRDNHKGLFYVEGYFNVLLFNARELLFPRGLRFSVTVL